MQFTVLIPARLASTRLPDKPLADIAGLPMVVRVAQRVLQDPALGSQVRVVVACDSPRILQACAAHGVESILTRTDHASGSDRLAEACELLGLADAQIVVNVQGDEPLIDPELVRAVAALLQQSPDASITTAAHPIDSLEDYLNPNVVKVVLDARSRALYFSRAPIPLSRDQAQTAWWKAGDGDAPAPQGLARPLRHIGIYAYRAGFLRSFPTMPQAPVEVVEALEQLRAMWHGHSIGVHVSLQSPGPGIDTPQDLERVRRLFGH
ncbi:MAG: 3-deoxy-manno-octulosonate cytidylyltransferase [Rhodoferax sp.]|nr:3-deoxy-manno-octulosonate cytidylyltransferase [Rhodoferax sp.]